MKIIIYPKNDGGVAIIVPVDTEISIHDIAAKDVPHDTPYEIIDSSLLPENREFRDAWEYDQQPGPKGT